MGFSYRLLTLTALCILLVLLSFEAYYVYADGWTSKYDLFKGSLTRNGASAGSATKTSQLHYVMPASSGNSLFCAVIASALVNRYPVPYIIGWRGEDEFNATAAHTAKLHSMKRYLDELPHGGDPDDLVIYGDGHDVMAQLPAEVIVERYFQVAADADRRLADRFGITVEEAHARGLRQTLFWGADKFCWPPLHKEPQCSAIPVSHLPRHKFGPKSGNGETAYNDARFLNSGSVIGPLGDLRDFIHAGLAEMEATFDPDFQYSHSDQVYLARLFGRQEKSRAEQIEAEAFLIENEAYLEVDDDLNPPVSGSEGSAPGGDNETAAVEHEYHVAIDYESSFVQTGCYSHEWMRKLNYNNSDNTATMAEDVFDQGDNFKPHKIQMPANVYKALLRVFDSVPELRFSSSSASARDWIGSLGLDTNVVTKHIFGFYHATCSKRDLIRDFESYWFYPFMEPLLKAAFRVTQPGEPITQKLIDGRRWEYKASYPEDEELLGNRLGGVFTDFQNETFISFSALCAEHLDIAGVEVPGR